MIKDFIIAAKNAESAKNLWRCPRPPKTFATFAFFAAKKLFAIALITFCSFVSNALPLTWRADWPDAKPVETLVHRGTDIELQPTWFVNKTAADTNGWTFTTFCQTNAVGPWFGPLPGAFFSHTNDVGAAFYNVMVRAQTPGGAVNYTAFARLRMLDSPGFAPGELPLPVSTIDFSKVVALNAPWLLTNDVESIRVDLESLRVDVDTNSAAIATLSDTTATNSAAIATLNDTTATLSNSIEVKADATNTYTKAQTDAALAGKVPTSRTVNGKALSSDVTIVDTDIPYTGYGSEYYSTVGAGLDVCSQVVASLPSPSDILYTDGSGNVVKNHETVSGLMIDSHPVAKLQSYQGWVPNHIVEFDANGDLAGSGKSAADFATAGGLAAASVAATNYTASAAQSATNYTDSIASTLRDSISTLDATKADRSELADFATPADVYRLIAGTNVVLVVTNYNSQTHAPAMKLQHLDTDSGQYVTYWDETRRHGMTLTNAMQYTDAAIETRAPRAWSGTTSGLGSEAPAGVTWISTPETVIAGGFEYEKVITSAGAVWVLASNGLTTGATTNSFFRVSASDGTELFSIEKTDSYLVGVSADGITRSGNTVTVPVNVVGNAHPYIRATTNLVDAVWTKEDENGFSCPWATVSWSGTTGAYVATITCSRPAAFFNFEYVVEGVAKIKNSAKTEMTGGIIFNGTTYMPTISGNELKFIAQ